jgi:glucose/arabinose dehydrogenase
VVSLGFVIVLAASLLRFHGGASANAANTVDPAFVDQVVATGLVLPTSMARLPDGRVLVAEKAGRVRVVKNGQVLVAPFLDFSAITNAALDRGLISVTVGPDFATTGYVYLTFVYDYDGSDASTPTTSRLVRVTANGDVMLANSQVVMLGPDTGGGCASQTSPTCLDENFPSHTIDQVTVAADGTLWVSLGDSANFDNPDQLSLRSQNLDSYRGKLLHVAANGDGLTSNPFYTNSVTTVRSKVYAYGFRNPYRFSINPVNNTIYVGDVGWGTVEEVDVVAPGANYGWPCYEGPSQQPTWASDPACQALYAQGSGAVKAPLISYLHNGVGAAVVMGAFTPVSTTFPAAFRNGFFYADYAQDWVRFQPVTATDATNGPSVPVATGVGGPVDFEFFPDGNLYFLTILTGELHRFAPVGGSGSTQYVSDLATVGTPVNGYGPFERDKSNGEAAAGDGTTLKVAGVSYDKGLGVHATSDLSFAVPAGCTTFLASVGIDDEVGTDPGAVVFEVWNATSGRLYQSALKSVGQAATAVNVSMTGVSTLRLVVTPAASNNWFDHADWGNARFSCSGGGGDVTAPSITGVGSTVTSNSATISWTTDEGSSSQVQWGTTTAYGSTTVLDNTMVTTHGQSIGGLLAGGLYHYRVRSVDASGNVGVSSDNIFTTSGSANGPTQFLSDLPITGTPVNGYGPFERDMSNGGLAAGDGTTLRVAGVSYAKGLGVHAASDLSFAVPSGCTSFQASVGIDDEVGTDPGVVGFEVWNGTSTRLYQSALKSVGQAATGVDVSTSGVSTLRLVVTPGGSNNWFDHADWGNARFTCGATPPDTTPPVITAITASPTATAATITWTTDEPSSTRIDYGPTTAYGSSTTVDGTQVTSHSQILSGLTASTLYHYRVRSVDASTNSAVSADQTFTTASGGGPVFGNATTYSTGIHAHASAIADFNGDGIMDVAVATAGSNAVTVRLGTGGGALGPPVSFAVGSEPKSVAVGDFNADGKLDLVTANQGNGTDNVSMLLGNGDGTFGAATSLQAAPNSHEVAVGDLNGDGKLDLAVVGWGGSVASVLLGHGDGTFAPKVDYTVGAAPHSVVIVDLNGDGKLDLATANHDSGTASVLIGNGNGTFAAKADYTVGSGPHSIRAGDLNGDGRPELVVANDSSSSISVLHNNGNGTFAAKVDYATTSTPKSVAVADVNGDGKLDVLVSSIAGNYPDVVNPGADRVALFLGNGTGTLSPRTDYIGGSGAFSVVIGDLNGDGRPDMIVSNWHDNTIQVRLNQS